jgi:hypothetical protein
MARSFNGTSNRIDCTFKTPQNVTSTMSASCWVFLNSTAVRQDIFDVWNADASANKEKWLLTFISGTLQFFISNDGFTAHGVNSTVAPSVGTWYNIVGTYNGSTAQKIYVTTAGGSTTTASANPGTSGLFSTTDGPRIGYDIEQGPVNSNFLNGSVADCGLWNVELTAQEVAGLATGARPSQIRTANVVGWWPLGGIQSPEPDLSGNAGNGTLTGTAPDFGPPLLQFTPRLPQFLAPPPVTVALWAQSCM